MGKGKQTKTPKKVVEEIGGKIKKPVEKKLNRDMTPAEKKRRQQEKEYNAMSPEKREEHDAKKAAKKERRKDTTKVINR
jgi:hypothetical protein